MYFWQKKKPIKQTKSIAEWEIPVENFKASKTAVETVECLIGIRYEENVEGLYAIIKDAYLHPQLMAGNTDHWKIRAMAADMAVFNAIKELNERIEKLEAECNQNPKT